MPDDPLERPFQNRPTPEVLDSLIYEIVDSEKPDFVQIPEGQYHPEVRDFPAHRLIKEERVAWNRVRRWWSDGFTNQDTYNYDIGYDHESATFPMYVRRYLIRRDEQAASTRNAAFTGVWQIRVTAGGTGYPPDTTVTVAAPGAGTTATAQAIIKDGVVVWIKIVTEGSGYTSAPVVTIAGTGGVDATATAVIQASAVLVSEKYQDLPEDDNRRSLYIACVRVWKILPGPVMESKEWGIGGLQKQTQTTDVAPSTTLAGGDNLVGEQMKEVTKAESQWIVEKLLTAAGGAISGDAEWTEETREGTSGVTFYRTYRFVDTDYTFPREGTVFKTGFFLDGQIEDMPGSPQFIAQFNWVKSDLGQVVFNTEREYVSESITHPVFAISRLVPIEDYSPSTVDAAFGEVLIADLTNGGSGYTSAPTLGTSGGGGSGFAGVAQVEGGIIVSIRITNGGTGFTGNTTITFTGGGGSGAAASGIIIPTTAVLVSQRARPAEGNLRPVFYRVLRMYKTLPGPTLTSAEWGPGGLQKRREVTDILPSTTLTTASNLDIVSEEIRAVTTAESQRIKETLRAADGSSFSGASSEYTLARRDGEFQVNVYTTFRTVAPSFVLPSEGSTFSISYPRTITGGRVISAKLTSIDGSPNCLAEITWTDAPEARADYIDYRYTFPGVLEVLDPNWVNYSNISPVVRLPFMGVHVNFRTPQSIPVTARRTLIFTHDATSYLPSPYKVVSPGSGSQVYRMLTGNCIHPAIELYITAENGTQVLSELLPASDPDSYDPYAILIAVSRATKWEGRWYVREIIEVSERTHPQRFPPLYTLTPFFESNDTDLLIKRLDTIGYTDGTAIIVTSTSAGDTTQTVKIIGKRNVGDDATIKTETVTLSGTNFVKTTRTDWKKVIGLTLSATTAGIVDVRAAGDYNAGSVKIETGITDGTTLAITRSVSGVPVARTFTFRKPETTTLTVGDVPSIGTKATGAFTITPATNVAAGDTVLIGGKTYTYRAAITGADNVDGYVLVGADGTESALNLVAAITLDVTKIGVKFADLTTVHTTVTASDGGAGVVTVTAIQGGPIGNAITTTETAANGAFGSGTLTGGAHGVINLYNRLYKTLIWFDKTGTDVPPAIVANEQRIRINVSTTLTATALEVATLVIGSALSGTGLSGYGIGGYSMWSVNQADATLPTLTIVDRYFGNRTNATLTNWSGASISVANGAADAADALRIGATDEETARALLRALTDMPEAILEGTAGTGTGTLSYQADITASLDFSRETGTVEYIPRVLIEDTVNLDPSLIVWTVTPGNAFLTVVTPTNGGTGPLIARFPAGSGARSAYADIDFWNPELGIENVPAGISGESDAIETAGHGTRVGVTVAGKPSLTVGYQTSTDVGTPTTWSATTNIAKAGNSKTYIVDVTGSHNWIRFVWENPGSEPRAVHAVALINLIT